MVLLNSICCSAKVSFVYLNAAASLAGWLLTHRLYRVLSILVSTLEGLPRAAQALAKPPPLNVFCVQSGGFGRWLHLGSPLLIRWCVHRWACSCVCCYAVGPGEKRVSGGVTWKGAFWSLAPPPSLSAAGHHAAKPFLCQALLSWLCLSNGQTQRNPPKPWVKMNLSFNLPVLGISSQWWGKWIIIGWYFPSKFFFLRSYPELFFSHCNQESWLVWGDFDYKFLWAWDLHSATSVN